VRHSRYRLLLEAQCSVAVTSALPVAVMFGNGSNDDLYMIALSDYLILAAVLFGLSIAGIFLNRKNVIILLMAIELMLLSVNMNFIAFSYFLGDTAGQIFVFFILTVAAAEAAIGLAILVVLFRNRRTINVQDLDTLQG
jgi:NADH-quinone oxidoreductase subunit K